MLLRDAMANSNSTPSAAPPAHEGVHYPNPSSKSLEAPAPKAEREGTQRLVWPLFFVLLLCVLAMSVVLGLVTR
jgi:hypothetical protein